VRGFARTCGEGGPNGGFGVWWFLPPNPALAGNACRWAAQLNELRNENAWSVHMKLITLECKKCGASLQIEESATKFTCRYCQTVFERENTILTSPTPNSLFTVAERSFSRGEYGKAMQFIEQGLAIDPNHSSLLALEDKTRAQLNLLAKQQIDSTKEKQEAAEKLSEAEQYATQASLILQKLQLNNKINKASGPFFNFTKADPANVDLGIQYIKRALEYFPDNARYLNTAALLFSEGKKDKKTAVRLLEKAHALDPRDITIENNLKAIRS
jgi:tetratricopeptide (TPR) repeat protein